MNIDTVLASVSCTALANLRESGSLTPVVLLFKDEALLAGIVLDHSSEMTKSLSIASVRAKAKVLSADFAVMIVEAWVAAYDQGQNEDVQPSKREDRKEVVVIQAQLRDNDPFIRLYEIQRDWKGKAQKLIENTTMKGDSMAGRFVGML
jgi:hypothetical protein